MKKLCPKCNKEIFFKSEICFNRSIKNNSLCRLCALEYSMNRPEVKLKISKANKGRKLTDDQKKKISIFMSNRKLSNEHKKKIGLKHKNKVLSNETRKKISLSRIGKPWNGKHSKEFIKKLKERNKNFPGFLGKKHSCETKKKMRISTIKYLQKKGKLCPRIGRNETRLLDDREKLINFKIIRQYHIKKLGYIVDGYCKNNNTVYEVYEKKHLDKTQKDLIRQKEIQEFLNCNFIIIWD